MSKECTNPSIVNMFRFTFLPLYRKSISHYPNTHPSSLITFAIIPPLWLPIRSRLQVDSCCCCRTRWTPVSTSSHLLIGLRRSTFGVSSYWIDTIWWWWYRRICSCLSSRLLEFRFRWRCGSSTVRFRLGSSFWQHRLWLWCKFRICRG